MRLTFFFSYLILFAALQPIVPGAGGGGASHVKRTEILVPFRVKKVALVPLRLQPSKSTAVALAAPFRVMSRKNKTDL